MNRGVRRASYLTIGIAIGIAVGALFGAMSGNMAWGIGDFVWSL